LYTLQIAKGKEQKGAKKMRKDARPSNGIDMVRAIDDQQKKEKGCERISE